MRPRSPQALVCAVAAALCLAVPSGAREPDLAPLVLDWAVGRYMSPVICEVDGAPIRGARYFEIVRAPRRPDAVELRFEDLDASEATRCYDDLGRTQANLVGRLELVFRGRSRPGMATRDFRERLKRDRGFEYSVRAGAIVESEIGAESEPRRRSLRGASLQLRAVEPGSDDDRLLAGLRGLRGVVFELAGGSATKLHIPAVQVRSGEASSR